MTSTPMIVAGIAVGVFVLFALLKTAHEIYTSWMDDR